MAKRDRRYEFDVMLRCVNLEQLEAILTNSGVGGDPASLNTRSKIVEGKLDAMLRLLLRH